MGVSLFKPSTPELSYLLRKQSRPFKSFSKSSRAKTTYNQVSCIKYKLCKEHLKEIKVQVLINFLIGLCHPILIEAGGIFLQKLRTLYVKSRINNSFSYFQSKERV